MKTLILPVVALLPYFRVSSLISPHTQHLGTTSRRARRNHCRSLPIISTTPDSSRSSIYSSSRRDQSSHISSSSGSTSGFKGRTTGKNDALVRTIDSILYDPSFLLLHQDDDNFDSTTKKNRAQDLKLALEWIKKSSSSDFQLQRARGLLTLDMIEAYTTTRREDQTISEKLIKVLALIQSTELAVHLLNSLLQHDSRYLPPEMAVIPVLTALRHACRNTKSNMNTFSASTKIFDILTRLTNRLSILTPTPTKQQQGQRQGTLSIMAWNVYLAALCDEFEQSPEALQTAMDWLIVPDTEEGNPQARQGWPLPDVTSYNTVLFGAAKAHNATMVEYVWQSLLNQQKQASNGHNHNVWVQPDTRSYNARLMATSSSSKRLKIWDELLKTGQDNKNNRIRPDRYTLDLVLLPLLEKRPDELESVLSTFVERQPNHVVIEVLAAFLTTLVNDGKVAEARHYIFDVYLLPCLADGSSSSSSSRRHNNKSTLDCSTRIQTRHFNILMDGYRNQASEAAQMAASKAVALAFLETSNVAPRGKGEMVDDDDESKESLLTQVQELTSREQDYRIEGRRLFDVMIQSSDIAEVTPDSYTLTSMMGLLETSEQIVDLLHTGVTMGQRGRNRHSRRILSPAVIRSAITAAGKLGDATLACAVFDAFHPMGDRLPRDKDPRLWNVLLGALGDCAEQDFGAVVDTVSSATLAFQKMMHLLDGKSQGDETILSTTLSLLQGKTYTQAVQDILIVMDSCGVKCNWQTYCTAAAALQYDPNTGPDLAMRLFHNASQCDLAADGADGRFINAIFRCFGNDIDRAIAYWKSDLRSACIAYESRSRPVSTKRATNKNLIAAYNGLMHVCGRAERPDIGVRLAYAMIREGIEPNEITLNNYRAGKRLRDKRIHQETKDDNDKPKRGSLDLLTSWSNFGTIKQYESLLYVECTKYSKFSKRMAKDHRVRIIL